MNAEYGQKAPFITVCIWNVKHKWAILIFDSHIYLSHSVHNAAVSCRRVEWLVTFRPCSIWFPMQIRYGVFASFRLTWLLFPQPNSVANSTVILRTHHQEGSMHLHYVGAQRACTLLVPHTDGWFVCSHSCAETPCLSLPGNSATNLPQCAPASKWNERWHSD